MEFTLIIVFRFYTQQRDVLRYTVFIVYSENTRMCKLNFVSIMVVGLFLFINYVVCTNRLQTCIIFVLLLGYLTPTLFCFTIIPSSSYLRWTLLFSLIERWHKIDCHLISLVTSTFSFIILSVWLDVFICIILFVTWTLSSPIDVYMIV
jgi:hypothetical protein